MRPNSQVVRPDESLLKTRSYTMSILDIAMAGGVLLLVVLIIMRKKTR